MDKKSSFSRKVYITYKSRINAAERLNKTEKFIQGINIYYSIFLTALAIYAVSASSSILSLMMIICSVIVTITIVFLASQKYGERAKSLKNNYIALSRLCTQIDDSDSEEKLIELNDVYTELLDSSENHSVYDYYKAKLSIKEEKEINPLTLVQKALYFSMGFLSILAKLTLIALPFMFRYFALVLDWIINIER
jgi:hypothetical protein